MRFKLGLKAWSTNLALIPEAVMAYREGNLDYVEIFCVPGSFADTAAKWSESALPFVVHAPHSMTGLNFARAEMESQNIRYSSESLRMADALRADIVIFHPGSNGSFTETIRQIGIIRDSRMILENKPFRGLDGSICIGALPIEISAMCSALNLSFCLDFGHAIAAANSHRIDAITLISDFVSLNPTMFHLTDGVFDSELDHHEMYGNGSFPLKRLLQFVPNGARVSDEAKRSDDNSLADYLVDREWIEKNA